MAKNETTPAAAGHNLTELATTVRKAAERITALKDERDGIGEVIAAVRKGVKEAGVPLKAFDEAVRAAEREPDKRAEHDMFVSICRDALGVPVQGELFGDAHEDAKAAE